MDAVRQHFPESDKTHKGHGRKTPSKLRSTKLKGHKTLNQDEAFQLNRPVDVPLRPIKKAKQYSAKYWTWRTKQHCVTTREKSDSGVNVKLKKKLTLLENYECLG